MAEKSWFNPSGFSTPILSPLTSPSPILTESASSSPVSGNGGLYPTGGEFQSTIIEDVVVRIPDTLTPSEDQCPIFNSSPVGDDNGPLDLNLIAQIDEFYFDVDTGKGMVRYLSGETELVDLEERENQVTRCKPPNPVSTVEGKRRLIRASNYADSSLHDWSNHEFLTRLHLLDPKGKFTDREFLTLLQRLDHKGKKKFL